MMNDFYKSLAGLLKIPSIAHDGDEQYPFGIECDRALEYVLNLCDSFGFRTKRCSSMLGWAEIGEGEEIVGILVHLDVVPAGEGWDYPPFDLTKVECDGEVRLLGRGVEDDKGPAMLLIYAMKKLLDSGMKLGRRIRIIFGLTEERGEWKDMEYYVKTEELPAFGITPDANFPAIYGEKGILCLELTMPKSLAGIDSVAGGSAHNVVPDHCECVVGGKKFEANGISSHASVPQKGKNAIFACMEIVNAEAPCALSKFICDKFDENCDGSLIGCAMSDKESGALTLNVGVIEVRGDDVVITLDIRYPVTASYEAIADAITADIKPCGVSCKLGEHKAPVYSDKNGKLITALSEVYREITGDDTEPFVIGGGTYARAMPNIVAFGPAFPDSPDVAHKKNEYMRESDLIMAQKIYEAALIRMLEI